MAEMSKTPEEIKKGLECAENAHCPDKSCAYYKSHIPCSVQVQKDALALIQQLERDKSWASENYDLIREENKRLEAQNAELVRKSEQLERERNAAIHDINKAQDCRTCKHINVQPPEQPCRSCGLRGKDFEWRGPCEENGGSDS